MIGKKKDNTVLGETTNPDNQVKANANAREVARKYLVKTLTIGVEFGSEVTNYYGVLLHNVYGTCPYRIQYFDKNGFTGHTEVEDFNQAIDKLLEDFGDNIKAYSGILDKLFPKFEPKNDELLKHDFKSDKLKE